jgi:hypothetical protein
MLPRWRTAAQYLPLTGGCAAAMPNVQRTGLKLIAADAGLAGVGHNGSSIRHDPLEVVMTAKRPDFEREWS